MFEKISGRLILKKMNWREASVRNPSILLSSVASNNREFILDKCAEGKFDEVKQFLAQKGEQQDPKENIVREGLHKFKKIVMLIKSR